MHLFSKVDLGLALLPAILMAAAALWTWWTGGAPWRRFNALALAALVLSILALAAQLLVSALGGDEWAGIGGWLAANLFGAWVSVLVQLLGAAIGIFSFRHLQGEPRQSLYITALAAVLAGVHVLLLANHWVVLILAWAAIQRAMHELLCFYPERPFALLAAHKKRVTDRAVDGLLVAAAGLAWWACGSGSLAVLWQSAAAGAGEPSWALQWSGVCLVLAVIARTALMPVHGWLVQVMEAPTPVSALLHAGVVNLGGYVLVLFAPLLAVAPAARWLLVAFGLVSAVVAGLVLLTRVSQKVHLAWSTIAQMGFMLLECGLGLYLLAALHLLGHSLYKAHNFLAASEAVKDSRRKLLTGEVANSRLSMAVAVPVAVGIVAAIQFLAGNHAWPWWWSGVLALAWAPLLWVPVPSVPVGALRARAGAALGMVVALTVAACIVDRAPVGAGEAPLTAAGGVALAGMALMYFGMVAFQLWPRSAVMVGLRRWVYAGFYMDEIYTRWVLHFWPVAWAQADASARLPSITRAPASPSSLS